MLQTTAPVPGIAGAAPAPDAAAMLLHWTEHGQARSAVWRAAAPVPRRVLPADDRINADTAYRLACEGTALLWRGDYHNARQLLQALVRRLDRPARHRVSPADTPAQAFYRHRQTQAQRARVLGLLLLPLEAGYQIPLRRAPDLRTACTEAWGPSDRPAVAPLRELLGVVGAHEWRHKGVDVPALGARIHPHHGVFSPVRGEYVDLVARAPLPAAAQGGSAWDIGTGTGVLAALLARRGVARLLASDNQPRALACARDNLARLGLAERVEVLAADLFPPGRAPLIVCNPPWLPARPSSPLEHAVYDPDSRMLRGFLSGLAAHLDDDGEGWLILSDLAEHLGLRSRAELLAWIEAAGLCVADRLDIRPRHPKAGDARDPLHAARAAELTSLWRLQAVRPGSAGLRR